VRASRHQWSGFHLLARVRVAGPTAFAEAGITHNDVDHLMIYDAPCSLPGASFAHLPIYGFEDLGFVPRGEAGRFIAERNTRPRPRDGPQGRPPGDPAQHQWRRPLLHAFQHVRHLAGERAPDARHRSCADPRRQDLGLPRRRRHVRRLRYDHHVERAALSGSGDNADPRNSQQIDADREPE